MTSKKFGIIYRIFNNKHNKSYIGQTTRSLKIRIKEHKRNKHLKDLFEDGYEVSELYSAFDSESLNDAEKYFVALFIALSPQGYNLKNGGVIGSCHTELSRVKNSRALGGEDILAINLKTKTYKVYKTQHSTEADGFDVRNVNAVLKNKRPSHKGHIFKLLTQVNQSGSTESKIPEHAQRLVIEPSVIENIIEEYKITTRDRHPNKIHKHKDLVLEMYKNGESSVSISNKLNINKKSILKLINEYNLSRTLKEAYVVRKRMMR